MKRSPILVFAGFVLATGSALAQATLTLPDASPAATVSQTVGMTTITIDYHRPAVNKRKVWGELVPYGDVWRAGANMNTTLTSSSAFTVGGKTLPAGTYGLHMIPTEKDWTVIFSNMHTAWGSFSYDQAEDAVRFTVSPKAVVFASIEGQLRGLPRFGWQGWNQAANWSLRNDYKLDQGLAWVDHSIGMQSNFQNLRTKAAILEKKGGDAKEVEALRAQAMKVATENDVNLLGYQLMGEKKTAEALVLFRKNVKDYPNSWNTYDSLGEALATTGDKKGAIENYSKALAMTNDPVQKKRIEGILAKLKA